MSSQHTEDLERIKVLIVDDQAMVRSGLKYVMLAFGDLMPVGEAKNANEALELCHQANPDVILLDLMVAEIDAINTTRIIRQRFPHIQVIALTSFWEEELVQETLDAGAIGYLLKNVSADELRAAIRAAYKGQPFGDKGAQLQNCSACG